MICFCFFNRTHSHSCDFGLGKIDKDQVADYAKRKGIAFVEMERWLRPNLAYDPE